MKCPKCGAAMKRLPYVKGDKVRHYWYCATCGYWYTEE